MLEKQAEAHRACQRAGITQERGEATEGFQQGREILTGLQKVLFPVLKRDGGGQECVQRPESAPCLQNPHITWIPRGDAKMQALVWAGPEALHL